MNIHRTQPAADCWVVTTCETVVHQVKSSSLYETAKLHNTKLYNRVQMAKQYIINRSETAVLRKTGNAL